MGGIRMNGLILAGANSSRSVPRQNRVYDLRREPADGEIFDRSRNGNNAILSTGWAVTLDGITGHLHVTFATQQNVTVLTARVRSSTDTTFYAGTENASGTDTIVANDTWQDVSVTISDAVADELFVGSDDGSTNFFAGDICDVRVASVGTWYLNDHPAGSLDGLPAFDSSGNGNDGVHVGGTSIVGVGAPVPQTALQDWNAGYITNTSNYYDLGNLAGFNVGTNDFSFGFGCLVKTDIQYEIFTKFNTTGGASFRVFRRPTTGALVVSTYSDGTTGSLTGGDSVPGALPIGKVVNFEFIKSGTSFVIYKNGAIFDTLTVGADVFNSTTKLQVNARDGLAAAAGLFMFDVWFKNNGTEIVRVPLVGNPAPDLTGATMVGTPDNVYLPEASDNPGFDVLGNAIANPRGYLLNPRGVAGDYAEILDDPSLDVTTEMSGALVGNLYPATASTVYIYHRYYTTPNKRVWLIGYFGAKPTGVIRFYLSGDGTSAYIGEVALPDADIVLSWTFNAGTFKVYINGTETTVTTIGATPVPASMFTTDLPVRLFQDSTGANPSDKQFGKTLMYNKALSASEHAQLYRALRRYL